MGDPGDRLGEPGAEGQEDSPERSTGLTLESCYRHPRVVTGVHCTRCGRPICPDCMTPAPVGYQCPECVKEARGSGPRRAVLRVGRTWSAASILLAVNIGVYLVEVVVGGPNALFSGPNGRQLVDLGALYPPALVFGDQYWRLFTAMFLHAGLLHLFFNMYALYLFGNLMEQALGTVKFLAIYFVCGLFASAVSFAFGNPNAPAVGASGAIFALLGAWVAYNFRRRQNPMASANLRWALILIGLNVFLGFAIPNVDYMAHVGGLVSGAAAGWVAEGFGPRNLRPFIQAGGFLALIVIGVALTAWRVATLT